jgi:fructose-1,6-bisphosphatase/sedoheptulose 1,7-bisphosphatase-like protein
MGIGGAPEGVLTAAAMRCLNGDIQGRLKTLKPSDTERMEKMGIEDPDRIYRTEDLAPGKNIVFSATGVTSGDLMTGVRFFGEGARTHSLVMNTLPRLVRFVDTIHVREGDDVKIRF